LNGSDGAVLAWDLVNEQGSRWFDPNRPIQVVHRDVATLVGGVRALLLQTLHPAVMAGVAQHSNYRTDPWGRLQRTSIFLEEVIFGTADRAAAACARVRRVHAFVKGVTPAGTPYDATDPHLMAWVHLTEVDSFLAAHQRFGSRKLTSSEADGYVADMAKIAEALGIHHPPRSVATLADDLDAYRSELAVTPEAAETIRFVRDPPLPLAARPAYRSLAQGALMLLPSWASRMIGSPGDRQFGESMATRRTVATVATLRWALGPSVPPLPVGAHR
jgi:uncharacterized protein (DUF2236 family)